MNLLAGMVGGIPVVGILFAAIVYLIGHVFNFAMGLLSAYVHDGRLQYLEFLGSSTKVAVMNLRRFRTN